MDSTKVFLYGEWQTSLPAFTKEIWSSVNEQLKDVKGLLSKTWLYGVGTKTIGGLYLFDSLETAREFATGIYAEQAKHINASLTVKLFDANAVEEASRDLNSPYFS